MLPKPSVILIALWCFFYCAWPSGDLHGLDPTVNIDNYNLEMYTTEDGLPQSTILTMIQGKDGFIWLGTYEGLVRFDGAGFRVFDKTNTPALKSNRIKALMEDEDGTLWVGTSAGLVRYRRGEFANFTESDGMSGNFSTAMCRDGNGTLWIGTTTGLSRCRDGVFTAVAAPALKHTYIMSLLEDGKGDLLIGTSGGGLYRMKGGDTDTIKHCSIAGIPDTADIRTLQRDKLNRIWLGTDGFGIAVLSENEVRVYTSADGLSGNNIHTIYHDSQGTTWIGTHGNGLNAFRNNRFTASSSEYSLFHNPVRSLLEDHEGSLWVGTQDGLTQLMDGKFIIYNKRAGLPVDSVRSVFRDVSGTIWLGTEGAGLVRLDGDGGAPQRLDLPLKDGHIWSIAQQEGDLSIWIGTFGGGLYQIKDNRIAAHYSTAHGLASNIIRALYISPQNEIRIGTSGRGIDRLYNGTVTNLTTADGLSDNSSFAITGDTAGNTWIGTYEGNLNKISNGKVTVYGKKEGLPGRPIWSVYVDRHDRDLLWLGTDGGGLVRFKNGRSHCFTTKEGLFSDLAFVVLEDQQERLWMNCNQGVYNVRIADLEAFMAGNINQIPSPGYGRQDGIKYTECNGPAQPAGLCTPSGKLWFPTTRGAIVIDPQKMNPNEIPPPVIIESVMVDQKPLYTYPNPVPGDGVSVPAGSKRLVFAFSALSYKAPSRITFKYKLQGFDEHWNDGGTLRQVSYTNIEPGDYRFEITACNSDGVWNKKTAALSFTLEPLFVQTLWFRLLVVALFAAFSYLVIGVVKRHLRLIAFWNKKKLIGAYEIEEQIGSGGMGIVYRVHSIMDKSQIYAVKVLKDEFLKDEIQKKRFKNEALLVDRIDHPNIVKVHERGEDHDQLYIVMESLNGKTLAERYRIKEKQTIAQGIHIMLQIADILVHLHKENIIHRDLKPDNIMLIEKNGDPDYVKLLDFGIARMETFATLTESGQVMGTLPYMPPEILQNCPPTTAMDIYSLGVIGYEMMTGKRPFSAPQPVETMKNIINDTPLQPLELNKHVPLNLNRLILQMLEKKPQNRPAARDVRDTLAAFSTRTAKISPNSRPTLEK